ncbi:U6 snRNA-associated Sm-like protein LSm8 [Strigomonas culicis]|uniref:U6 snRNA-associated Sm-like protein LSm8 n=1 Tax=Strigomonas culicis TaxID=28005 RepID=S9WAK5_9TRYP|nr:U6 snRNA-associated Sm-like protein LSm8 [Strigomonas culicis]|eukprot:EPY36126.1 U6 snRNA-associated Sm-like protein LSm8 [Strigomonas culicis]
MLTPYLRKRVSVLTTDGRHILGILHSADQLMNVVVANAVERVAGAPGAGDAAAAVEEVPLGVLLLRGADVLAVAELNVFEEAQVDVGHLVGRDLPACAR